MKARLACLFFCLFFGGRWAMAQQAAEPAVPVPEPVAERGLEPGQETPEAAGPADAGQAVQAAGIEPNAPAAQAEQAASAGELSLKQDGAISDPTQMTGSFSQALNRIQGKSGQAGPGLPDISLAAKAICNHDKKAVMLNVAGKTRMVKQGSRFSFLEGNLLHEIRVDKIEADHVDLTLLSAGRQMILQ